MRCPAAEIYISHGSFMKAMSQAPVNDWLTYGWEGGRERTSTGCSVFPFAFLRMRGLPYVSAPRAICKRYWRGFGRTEAREPFCLCHWAGVWLECHHQETHWGDWLLCVRARRRRRWHHVSAPISVGVKQMVLCRFLNGSPILKLRVHKIQPPGHRGHLLPLFLRSPSISVEKKQRTWLAHCLTYICTFYKFCK